MIQLYVEHKKTKYNVTGKVPGVKDLFIEQAVDSTWKTAMMTLQHPVSGTYLVTEETLTNMTLLWYRVQLMEIKIQIFTKLDVKANPPVLDMYDLFYVCKAMFWFYCMTVNPAKIPANLCNEMPHTSEIYTSLQVDKTQTLTCTDKIEGGELTTEVALGIDLDVLQKVMDKLDTNPVDPAGISDDWLKDLAVSISCGISEALFRSKGLAIWQVWMNARE